MKNQTQNTNENQTKISPKFGGELLRFGKWIVTTKGLLFERNQLGEADYFLEGKGLTDLIFMKEAVTDLLKENWLDPLDYHQFISAWFYKLSLLKAESKTGAPSLSDTLAQMQSALETKFSNQLIP